MVDRPEQRRNTVAISRQAASFAATLAATAFIGISTVFYQRGLVLADLTAKQEAQKERIDELKRFGPGTGRRFTWDDGVELKRELREVKDDLREIHKLQTAHGTQGAHLDADRRINAAVVRIERLELAVDAHARDRQ